MPSNFQKIKQAALKKSDKSNKQSWDKPIIQLCKKVNSLKDYYTTSSCSGRIVIMLDNPKKVSGLFNKVYHNPITFSQLKKDLSTIAKKNKKLIKFKQEPCILHVAASDLENAQRFYNKARLAGWKKHGIISSKKRFVVEITGTDKLEFPIINKGKILVDDDFLKLAVKKSNENLKKSWDKIEKLKKKL